MDKIENEQLKNVLNCSKESVEEIRSMLNDVKSLKQSHDHLLKKFQDLEKLVMSQNQNKTQNEQGAHSNRNSGNYEEPNFENPFCFEQPLKKIKLEDQSEEIQRLNQIIKDLKEDNLKLSYENTMLTKDYKILQIQYEAVVKNLKEDKLKLLKENTKLSVSILRTTMPTRPTVAQTSSFNNK